MIRLACRIVVFALWLRLFALWANTASRAVAISLCEIRPALCLKYAIGVGVSRRDSRAGVGVSRRDSRANHKQQKRPV